MSSRLVPLLLVALLAIVHAQLWFGRGSVGNVAEMQRKLEQQKAANLQAQQANERLAAEVRDLKEGLEMVEEKARSELGMVFQIADDALDLVADEETIGKPAGSDIREGKFTMPVLQALDGPSGSRVRELLEGNHPYADDVVEQVIEIVREGGFGEASLAEATRRLGKASAALAAVPDGEPKRILQGLGDYLLGRVESARLP